MLGFILSATSVHAQTTNTSSPDIKTYNTATSSTVVITMPSGYKSEVISNYDGNQFHTYATSSPLTTQDIQNIQIERSDLEQIFQKQEELFEEQNRIFQDMLNNIGW